MKNRLLLLTTVCALAFGPAVQAQDKEVETELGAKMDKMSSAFRALRRQIADPSKNADSLAKLATLKENALAAAKLDPDLKKEKPAAEQAKFVADYQAKMKETIDLVEKIEAALKANNNAEAQTLFASLGDAQKKGHDAFKKKDKKKS